MPGTDHDFILSRSSTSDQYGLWKLDSDGLTQVRLASSPTLRRTHHVAQVGRYVLEWGPLAKGDDPSYPYRLLDFDPDRPDPFEAVVQCDKWSKRKFFGSRADFGNPKGAKKGFDMGNELILIPLGNFVLNWIPTAGRGTYRLFNFDPGSTDPLPRLSPQGAWLEIQADHSLVPIRDYLIDWVPRTGHYRLWSVDPELKEPLSWPAVQEGQWRSIGEGHQLIPVGDRILDWDPCSRSYRVWNFDPESGDPLTGDPPTRELPKGFTPDTTLTGLQSMVPISDDRKDRPGTIDFMRSRVKHVVYYMLENRSFDHVCGWLYENDVPNQIIGPDGEFKGASTEFSNENGPEAVHLSKYKDGKLGTDFSLELLGEDPYHDNSDVLRQLFYKRMADYERQRKPNMGGFVWNNGTTDVMETYSPTQVPVLNGLARHFAVSDEWFSSMPGGTDVNRAFSVAGSSYGKLNNFQNGPEYTLWSEFPHRPSIWKVLWSNGIRDWKIYNAIEWMNCRFTYNLFLHGQIPSVDATIKETPDSFVPPIEQFFRDAENGQLPGFSFLEPIWVSNKGSDSYHPGGDIIPGERKLNDVFNALQNGPKWDETLLVITFDEHGGIYDHVPPPYAKRPYPNDESGGFRFDLMGVRVPTILVSPWINEKTVFRSQTPWAYDATSFLATLLGWYGVPRSRWGLGERTHHAPTFEGVLRRETARTDRVELTPPYDQQFPPDGSTPRDLEVHDLHRLMIPRMVRDIGGHRMDEHEIQAKTEEILTRAHDQKTLHRMLDDLAKRSA